MTSEILWTVGCAVLGCNATWITLLRCKRTKRWLLSENPASQPTPKPSKQRGKDEDISFKQPTLWLSSGTLATAALSFVMLRFYPDSEFVAAFIGTVGMALGGLVVLTGCSLAFWMKEWREK